MPKTMNKHHQKAATTMTHNTTAPNTAVPALRFPEFRGDKGWVEKKLGDIATFKKGKGLPKSLIVENGKYPCIHYGELFTQYSEVIDEVISFTNETDKWVYSLENDVLMPTSDVTPNGLAKASCIREDNVILGGDILIIRTNKEKIYGEFLSRYIRFEEYEVLKYVTGSTVYHLYASTIEKLSLFFPKLAEQQKIADCLAAIDAQITAEGDYLQALHSHKQGLLQRLFPTDGDTVPQLRFNGFDGEWAVKPLNKLANKCTEKNSDETITRVFTNSATMGVVDQRDYFEKDIANAKNLGGYIIVEKESFVYNPRCSVTAPVGPISKNKLGLGVMSPLYTVFKFKKEENGFYEQYFLTTSWHGYLKSVANSGARHDRMSISSKDFMAMPLPEPSIKEQQKIADCLSSLDDLITAQTEKIDALKQHKQGLMQQLFPRMDK